MKTPNIQKLCLNIWEARDAGNLSRDVEMLCQMIYVAVAADLALHRRYEVLCDRRVEWLWEMVNQLRQCDWRRPQAHGPLEDTVQFILFAQWPARKVSGREIAAGG